MIIFSAQQNRNCVSANNSQRKFRVKRQSTDCRDHKNTTKKYSQSDKENNLNKNDFQRAPRSSIDPFKEQMKYLIEQNSQYFQNKVKITDKVRPNQYRFKIPTKTPDTHYQNNFQFKDKDLSVDNVKINSNTLSQTLNMKESHQNLNFKSTYQNEFTFKKQSLKNRRKSQSKSKLKKQQIKKEDEVPRFMQTQNKCFYLNWGGRNTASSLKPSYQTVATNFPLDSKTIYKNDFQGKTVAPSKMIIPQSSITKLSNSFMINKTSYASDFTPHQHPTQKQKSCKPKRSTVQLNGFFKGSTEYQSEFIKNREISRGFSHEIKKQDLHALILDL